MIYHSNKRLLRAVTQFTLYHTNGLLAIRADLRVGAPCSRSGYVRQPSRLGQLQVLPEDLSKFEIRTIYQLGHNVILWRYSPHLCVLRHRIVLSLAI